MILQRVILLFIILSFSKVNADSLSIFFLGDTYFGESYQTNSKFNDGINVIEEYGYDYFFENVKDLLNQSDYTIVNFEAPLCGNKNVSSLKPYTHWCYPNVTLQYLKKYGVDAVSLGNNHAMDMGEEGLIESFTNLNAGGIKYFGAGVNDSASMEPLHIKPSSRFELALISGFEYRASYDSIYHFYSDRNNWGVNKLEIETLKEKIRWLSHANPLAYIIFFPHWGKNYRQAMDYQKEMAHALIDAGVDLIIGHGSHTVQETEMYKDRWIIYNIGNFIFNAPGRYSSTGAKPYGLMAELVVTANSKKLRLHPVFTNNLKTDYQLKFLDKHEFEECGSILGNKENINKLTGDRNYFEIKLY